MPAIREIGSRAKCESVTPRGRGFFVSYTGKLWGLLGETTGSVTQTLELPALNKPIGSLNSAGECVRLRVAKTAPQVTL